MRSFIQACVAVVSWLFAASAAIAAEPTLEQLAAGSQFGLAALSPDGRHIAISRPDELRSTLVIVDADSLAVVSELAFPRNEHVIGFYWVNEEMLVVANGTATGSLGAPRRAGELFAVSVDGSKQVYLFGYRASASRRNRGRSGDFSHGFVISTLPDSREEILIGELDWSGPAGPDFRPKIHRVNVYTGARRLVTQAPLEHAWITTDLAGQVRFAQGLDDDYLPLTYQFDPVAGQWQRLDPGLGPRGSLSPHRFVAAGDAFLAEISRDGEAGCLYLVQASDLQRERLSCVENFEISAFMPSSRRGRPLAAVYEAGLPRVHLFEPDSEDAQLYRMMQQQLAPAFVRFLGFSDDGRRLLIEASSDRDAGRLYLFDRETQRARLLFNRRPGLDPAKLAPTETFSFEARDGTYLQGLLTLPPRIEPSSLPLVVMPHGGPYGVSDKWSFDADAQVLATRGYAVLKVNFRGSGGRGGAFERLGYRQWGGAIQDDIVDATRWAVASGVADSRRVCLMGGSFGAYSALMSAIREPDLYRCAIGYAGVYDLQLMFARGDIRRTDWGRRYLDMVLGKDSAALAQQSPTAQVERLQAPVLLVHGAADVRAPLKHAQAMRRALRDANKPHEWFVVQEEAHGFFRAANRGSYYQRVLEFLEQHIGAANPPASEL